MEPQQDRNELEVVYTLSDPNTAEIVANALRSEGIACEIDGEHQAGFTGALEIRLLVRRWDADKARKIIESHEPL